MEIIVNNQPQKVADNFSVQQLAQQVLGDKQKGVAIAVNDTVVSKTQWDATFLKPNDNIIIIKATQGG